MSKSLIRIEAPASAHPGATVEALVIIRNVDRGAWTLRVDGWAPDQTEANHLLQGSEYLWPSTDWTKTIDFVMPNAGAEIFIWVEYYLGGGEWNYDTSLLRKVMLLAEYGDAEFQGLSCSYSKTEDEFAR